MQRKLILIYLLDYLDPYLQNKHLSPTDVKGFRSVLKLTPSHPRNPKFQ